MRFVIMTLVEVLAELTHRLGHQDLSEKCSDCRREVEAAEEREKKGGEPNG